MNVTVEIGDGIFLNVNGKYTPAWAGIRYYPDGSGQPPEPSEMDIESADLVFKQGEKSVVMSAPDDLVKMYYEVIMDAADEEFLRPL